MIWCIKTYMIAYVKTHKIIRYIIHYVKPTAQLLFKIRYRRILAHTIRYFSQPAVKEADWLGQQVW